jgi:hypothetical protein
MTDTTTNDTTSDLTNDASGQRSHDAVLADAVRVLTEAARRTVTWTDRDGHQHRQQADFAEFVTHAVAGAAANLGDIEHVLAGRAGSWEADKVRDMLHSTVGYDEQYLLEHRTEPVVVRVHVDDILNELGVWKLYDEAHDELDRRHDAIGIPTGSGVPGDPAFEAALAALEPATAEQEAARDAVEQLRERLDAQQTGEWAAYSEAFKANVLQAAGELFPWLRVPVEVIVELEWRGDIGLSDTEFEYGGPAWRLWETARLNTPLPGTGIALRDYPTAAHATLAQIERDAGRDPLARLENDTGEGSER